MSDNGYSCGHHGFWHKGNGTFPLNMYENSVKVPAIFSHPGVLPAGKVSGAMVSQYDFMPTLLEYLGLPASKDKTLPGQSFLPVLQGKKDQSREEVVVYDEYGPVRMIRTPEWKYIHRFPYGPHELYDMVHDPDERKNLVDDKSHQPKVEDLRNRMAKWFERYVVPQRDGARLPVVGDGQIRKIDKDCPGESAFFPKTEGRIMTLGILQEMTVDDVRRFRPEVVLAGIGSTEPHGPSMPYGTDVYQVDAHCRLATERANARGARVLMYPTLPIGGNVNFKPFPFACRISIRTLMLTLLDIIAALEEDGIRKIVLFNGHGGNTDAIQATLREHFDKTQPPRRAFVCMAGNNLMTKDAAAVVEHASDHGGEAEASRMMHIRPDLVHAEKFQDQPIAKPVIEFLSQNKLYYVKPWHRYMPMSAGGDTRKTRPPRARLW